MLPTVREQIAEYGRYIFETGLTSRYSGNISARDVNSGLIAIKPSGIPWMNITADDVVIVDEQGNVVEGERKPSIETPMHTAVYRNHGDVMAIVHTHSRFATGFAIARMPIPAICVNSVELGGEIPVLPYYPPGSIEIADAIATYLEGKRAVLLAAHGVICCGTNLDEAVYFNEVIEEIAEWAIIQKVLGSTVTLSPEEIDAIAAI